MKDMGKFEKLSRFRRAKFVEPLHTTENHNDSISLSALSDLLSRGAGKSGRASAARSKRARWPVIDHVDKIGLAPNAALSSIGLVYSRRSLSLRFDA
jgi:hypothetical protein